jgi:FkbM family methyltransferase
LQLFYTILYNSGVNNLIRNFLKLIPGLPENLKIPPSGVIKVNLKTGESFKLKTNQTNHVSKFVFWSGSSAYEYTDIFLALFPRVHVFFDVGANIGYYSVMAGKVNPKIKVYAFDPSPGPLAFLKENITLNGLKNVFAQGIGLSDSKGEFSFHIPYHSKYSYLKHNTLGGSGHLSHVRANPTTFKLNIQTNTLDAFIIENKINELDLIKLDVEEAEHLVLAGSKSSIERFRPIIVCEVFSSEMLVQIQEQIISLKYQSFIFENQKLREVVIDKNFTVEQIENFFFVPVEKLDWISEFV